MKDRDRLNSSYYSETQIRLKKVKTDNAVIIFYLLFLFFICIGLLFNFSPKDSSTGTTKRYSSSLSHSSLIKEQLKQSEIGYQIYLQKRRTLVDSNHPEWIEPWKAGKLIYFFDYLLPQFSCPFSLQRIGQLGDGGKWVCGMELFEKNNQNDCIIYSIGVAEDSSFEAELLERTNCKIWAFDGSVEGMASHVTNNAKINSTTLAKNLKFEQTYISYSNSNDGAERFRTLAQIMKENGHDWIDILKMDIEGQEFDVLDQILHEFSNKGLPFGQLLVEFHSAHGGYDGYAFAEVYKLWEKLEEAGLRPFRNEANIIPCVSMQQLPTMMEYSFINVRKDKRNKLIN